VRTRGWGRCCARAPPGTPGTPCPRAAPRTPGGGQYRVEAASHSPQAPGGRKGSEVHLLGSEAHPLDSAVHLQDLVAPPLGLAAPQGSVTGCQIASLTGSARAARAAVSTRALIMWRQAGPPAAGEPTVRLLATRRSAPAPGTILATPSCRAAGSPPRTCAYPTPVALTPTVRAPGHASLYLHHHPPLQASRARTT